MKQLFTIFVQDGELMRYYGVSIYACIILEYRDAEYEIKTLFLDRHYFHVPARCPRFNDIPVVKCMLNTSIPRIILTICLDKQGNGSQMF